MDPLRPLTEGRRLEEHENTEKLWNLTTECGLQLKTERKHAQMPASKPDNEYS